MTFALDTDTFTLAYHHSRGIRERIAAAQSEGEVVLPLWTRIEVLQGWFDSIRTAADGHALARAADALLSSETYLTEFRVLPFDTASTATFDRLRSDKKARKVRRKDFLIACIVLAHRATLVTRNTKDFALVPGFVVGKNLVNWAD